MPDIRKEIGILQLPPEVLQCIFAYYIQGRHQSALLSVISNVCTYFRKVCLQPCMWKSVDGSLSVPQLKILSGAGALKCTRKFCFSTYRQLSANELDDIFSGLTLVESINFGYLIEVKESYFQAVLKNCPAIKEIDLSKDFRFANNKCPNILDGNYLCSFLKMRGSDITSINLSHCRITSQNVLFKAIPQRCPNLEEFVLLDSGNVALKFPLNAFQNKCRKLRILLLDDAIRFEENLSAVGFPALEKFSFKHGQAGRNDYENFLKALYKSSKLKSLDVQSCLCLKIELLLPVPSCSIDYLNISMLDVKDIVLFKQLLCRWYKSLKFLDLSWMVRNIDEIVLFVASFPNLEKLCLKGTCVSANTVKKLIMECVALKELNLLTCTNLKESVRRSYYGQHELQNLLNIMNNELDL